MRNPPLNLTQGTYQVLFPTNAGGNTRASGLGFMGHSCLSLLQLLNNVQGLGGFKQQTLISHSSGLWDVQVKVQTDLVSGGHPPPSVFFP